MAEYQTRACGVLVFRNRPERSFLLMRHPTRWDLPKGHLDDGETDLECALRELSEETGILPDDVAVDPQFRFTIQYPVTYKKRFDGREALKTVVIFLGELKRDVAIQVTEHGGYEWFPWKPPHDIQELTINPLLRAVAAHLGPD